MSKDQIILTVLVALAVVLTAWAILYTQQQKKVERDTQRVITDLELLRLFEQHPGGLLSSEMIAEQTGLTKSEAGTRLTSLATGGLLRSGMTPNGMKAYFELSADLEEVDGIKLSGLPFLTIEDLQQLFIAYDYKVSPHDLIVSTGLPWKVIAREMQHFRKEGVIELVHIDRPGDSARQYILQEAYHQPEALDLASRERINSEVRQVLYDEQLLV